MPDTNAIVEEAPLNTTAPPSWTDDLTLTQRREIKGCLPFPLKALPFGNGWSWHVERPNLRVTVKYGEHKNSLVIEVFDGMSNEAIDLWRSELHLTGQWKRRLRQLAGEAAVLCQSRPRCPKCSAPLKVRRRHEDGVQFFGCTKYPNCFGTQNIIDHDVEHTS